MPNYGSNNTDSDKDQNETENPDSPDMDPRPSSDLVSLKEDSDPEVIKANKLLLADLSKDKELKVVRQDHNPFVHWFHHSQVVDRPLSKREKVVKFLRPGASLHEDIRDYERHCFKKSRKRVGEFVESKGFQYFIMALIFLDVAVLTTELALEREEKCEEHFDPALHRAELALRYTSWSILLIFGVEMLTLIFAFGWRFFLMPLYVLDFVIISLAIVFEIGLHEELSGFIIFTRFWRIARIIHGIMSTAEERKLEERKKFSYALAKLKLVQHQLKVTNKKLEKHTFGKRVSEDKESDDEAKVAVKDDAVVDVKRTS